MTTLRYDIEFQTGGSNTNQLLVLDTLLGEDGHYVTEILGTYEDELWLRWGESPTDGSVGDELLAGLELDNLPVLDTTPTGDNLLVTGITHKSDISSWESEDGSWGMMSTGELPDIESPDDLKKFLFGVLDNRDTTDEDVSDIHYSYLNVGGRSGLYLGGDYPALRALILADGLLDYGTSLPTAVVEEIREFHWCYPKCEDHLEDCQRLGQVLSDHDYIVLSRNNKHPKKELTIGKLRRDKFIRDLNGLWSKTHVAEHNRRYLRTLPDSVLQKALMTFLDNHIEERRGVVRAEIEDA